MSSYRRHYDSHFFDDLHNYLPALLYEPERFSSVQDVLEYVRSQARRRFDLFSSGEREYQASRQPAQPAAAVPTTTPAARSSARVQAVRSSIPPQPAAAGRGQRTLSVLGSLLGGAAPGIGRDPFEVFDTMNPTLEMMTTVLSGPQFTQPSESLSNLLSGLLSGGMPQGVVAPTGFMDPVPVRPTAADLEREMAEETVDAEDEVCAICQDAMEAGSTAAVITNCDHRFHPGCIDTWFQRSAQCPVCRYDIRGPAAAAGGTGGTGTTGPAAAPAAGRGPRQ
jgi:hypothetical protein